jgi:outer membrane protein OmpA-like peptidoglycan-associated protein
MIKIPVSTFQALDLFAGLFKLLIMSDSIGVEIEHVHYALFLDLQKDVQKKLDLTTLADNQRKAAIKVYLFSAGKKILLKEIEISPLPPKPAGEIKITLKGRLEKKRHLRLTVLFGKKQVHTSSVDLTKYHEKRSLWWVPVLLFVIAGAAAAVVFGTGTAGERRRAARSSEEMPAGEEREEDGRAEETRETGAGDTGGTDEDDSAAAAEEKAPEAGAADAGTADTAETAPGAGAEEGTPEPEAEPGPPAAEEEAAPGEAPEEEEIAAEEPAPPEVPAETIRRTVYFEPESAALTEESRGVLLQVLNLLTRYEDAKVEIIGHCALYPTVIERKTLSIERAEQVYSFLVTHGWTPEVPPDIRGVGGDRPVTTAEHQQHLNRRVEINILGKEE